MKLRWASGAGVLLAFVLACTQQKPERMPPSEGGAGSAGGQPGEQKPTNDCPAQGALVALTYDDTLPTHLDVAAPALTERKLRGTFFLNRVKSRHDEWTRLIEQGHELGAHTLLHPCPRVNTWVAPGNASEDYGKPRMAEELDDNLAELKELGQTGPYSFAYPCGITWVGEDHTSYQDLIEERFAAARGVGVGLYQSGDNLWETPGRFMTGSSQKFLSLVDQAIAEGDLAIFGFHGVGGDHQAVTQEVHAELLDYLVSRSDQVTVLPFRDAVQCVSKRHP